MAVCGTRLTCPDGRGGAALQSGFQRVWRHRGHCRPRGWGGHCRPRGCGYKGERVIRAKGRPGRRLAALRSLAAEPGARGAWASEPETECWSSDFFISRGQQRPHNPGFLLAVWKTGILGGSGRDISVCNRARAGCVCASSLVAQSLRICAQTPFQSKVRATKVLDVLWSKSRAAHPVQTF